MIRRFLALFLILIMLPLNVSAQADCPVEAWWDEAGVYFIDFLDTSSVADVTSRLALSPVVIEMHRARRSFQRVDHPDCLQAAVASLDVFMKATIDAFVEFMGNEDANTSTMFDDSLEAFREGLNALLELGYFIR